jgi:hypothetical protein
MTKKISTWTADWHGLFQGTPSTLGETVDAIREKLGKSLKVAPLQDA